MDNLDYIIDLFADADTVVRKAVDQFFETNGDEALSQLAVRYRGELDTERQHLLQQMLTRYCRKNALEGLRQIALRSGQGQECNLLEGTWHIEQLLGINISREAYWELVMPIAVQVMAETSPLKTAVENVHILNHIFYQRCGFKPTEPFDIQLTTTRISDVVRNRKGNPFVLSILYFMIAQSAGLPIYPMSFTGGFVPVYVEDGEVLFNINVFHEGEIFFEKNITSTLNSQIRAMGIEIDLEAGAVAKDHTILVMYLEYLEMMFMGSGDTSMQSLMEDAIAALGKQRHLSVEQDDDQDW
ncbi:MAG: hypothetical protein HUJ91_01885 [Bacteroidales bacterium]|nr:hypothetical protein [Bacteroidales bacterium]